MAMIACPECQHIYKAPDSGPYYCPICGWDGRWKQQPDPGDEQTREIEFPALRGCH
jgi:hypothetical protein